MPAKVKSIVYRTLASQVQGFRVKKNTFRSKLAGTPFSLKTYWHPHNTFCKPGAGWGWVGLR